MGNETVADVADLALLREILGDSPAARMLIELETLRAEKAAHAREVEALRLRAEAAEAMSGEPGLLRLLVDLRFALGDNGKRMQDELVEYARDLAADARRYRWLRGLDGQCDAAACVNFNLGFDWQEAHGPELDAAIDAAIASGGEG